MANYEFQMVGNSAQPMIPKRLPAFEIRNLKFEIF